PASTCDLAIQGGDAGGASKHAGQLVEGRLLARLEQGFGADREQLAGAEAEIVGDRQSSLGVAGAARLGPSPPEEQQPSRDQERRQAWGGKRAERRWRWAWGRHGRGGWGQGNGQVWRREGRERGEGRRRHRTHGQNRDGGPEYHEPGTGQAYHGHPCLRSPVGPTHFRRRGVALLHVLSLVRSDARRSDLA